MNKSNDQIAQGGQDLWSMAGASAGAIFQKGDITHVMRPIFNAKVGRAPVRGSVRAKLAPEKGW
jgi:hypothetical protein